MLVVVMSDIILYIINGRLPTEGLTRSSVITTVNTTIIIIIISSKGECLPPPQSMVLRLAEYLVFLSLEAALQPFIRDQEVVMTPSP